MYFEYYFNEQKLTPVPQPGPGIAILMYKSHGDLMHFTRSTRSRRAKNLVNIKKFSEY